MHLVGVDSNAGPCGPGCACETGGKLDPGIFEEGDETTVSSGQFHSLTQFTPAGDWHPSGAVLAFDCGVTVGELREAMAYLDETDVVTLAESTGDRTWVEFEPAAVANAPSTPAREPNNRNTVMGAVGIVLLLFALTLVRPVGVGRTPNLTPQRRKVAAIVHVDQDRVPDLGRRAA